MLRLIFFTTFCVFFTASIKPGPEYPPTQGQVWPKPQNELKSDNYFRYLGVLHFTTVGSSCDILTNAINRYTSVLNNLNSLRSRQKRRLNRHQTRKFESDTHYQGTIQELEINLSSPCDEYPHLNMNEQYSLNVSTYSKLSSDSIWGVLRGMESFVQLFYLSEGYTDLLINATVIEDFPRYAHRGLLVDTSRHYIRVANILKTLDAMAINKMNVFHWHIVDDQSFPYQSEKFPELSARGAYHPSMIYTKTDITRIINYARDRGIRVLPEFDVPGHTRSWGEAYPALLIKCYSHDADYGPLNPIHNATYKFMRDLFEEVQSIFPDDYLHVGGDEVDLACWLSNPEIRDFMNDHNMKLNQVFAYFMANIVPLLGQRSKPIVWQEVFDEGVPLPDNTIVQTWKTEDGQEMAKVLDRGYKVVSSEFFYLDHLKSGGDWIKYYVADPRTIVSGHHNSSNIVGGEACMWSEVVDDTNIFTRMWPRASAVAEVLWSEQPIYNYRYMGNTLADATVKNRLEEHACRMNRRGIPAQPPNGPGYCYNIKQSMETV